MRLLPLTKRQSHKESEYVSEQEPLNRFSPHYKFKEQPGMRVFVFLKPDRPGCLTAAQILLMNKPFESHLTSLRKRFQVYFCLLEWPQESGTALGHLLY